MLLKPDYVLPEFCMHVQYIPDGLRECSLNYFPCNASHNGSRTAHTTPSRRISVPAALTLCSDISDALNRLGVADDTERSQENSSLFSGNESVGTLLMRNRVLFDDVHNPDYGISDQNCQTADSRIDSLSSLPISINAPKVTGMVSSNHALMNKQAIVRQIENVGQDFNYGRIKILMAACERRKSEIDD